MDFGDKMCSFKMQCFNPKFDLVLERFITIVIKIVFFVNHLNYIYCCIKMLCLSYSLTYFYKDLSIKDFYCSHKGHERNRVWPQGAYILPWLHQIHPGKTVP